MKCPYCSNSKSLDNSNLSHKFCDTSGCRNYFKVCNICNTIFVNKHKYDKFENHNLNIDFKVQPVPNILKISECPNCKRGWLPDFPLSWLRSITNLDKLYELISDINKNENYGVGNGDLLNLQQMHFSIKYNKERADKNENYFRGALVRRIAEYINQLKIMGIIRINSNGKYILTDIGYNLVQATKKGLNDLQISYYVLSYINIKLTNGYQKKVANSCYEYFKIRFIENILKSVDYVNEIHNKAASKYQIGLSVLCRNEDEFEKYCLENIERKAPTNIKEFMFNGEKELERAVVSGFLNVFIELNLLDKQKDLYSLTPFGKAILCFLEKRPSIWYEDIKKYSRPANETFAKLILWRLVKNKLLSVADLSIDFEDIEKDLSYFVDVNNIEDIHLNLFYDEPIERDNTEKILSLIKSYLCYNISSDALKCKCYKLDIAWINNINQLVNNYIPKELIEIFSEKSSFKKGEKWEIETKKYFEKLGFEVTFYKENPVFSELQIPTLNIYLPGGTLYNPDLLMKESYKGSYMYILIDSKGANSIINEVHKLKGYNLYVSHPEVNSYAIIPLNGTLSKSTKDTLLKDKESFDKICIIEKSALEVLISKKLSKEKLLDLIIPSKGFKHITANDVK